MNQMRNQINKLFHKEWVLYILGGVTTSVVSVFVYILFSHFVDYKTANIISIILAKVYAYFINKLLIFKSSNESLRELLHEIVLYILARGGTGLIDFFGVIALVEIFCIEQHLAKYAMIAVVIVLNYILGKKIVFTKKEGKRSGL